MSLFQSTCAPLCLLMLPALSGLSQAQSSGEAENLNRLAEVPEFDGLLDRWQKALVGLGVPGCSIAVVMDGQVLGVESMGVRNPAGDPVDEHTMFYVASCTKTYTAMALARLADGGKLDLDAPVSEYLPRFRLADEQATRTISVRDLLCHRRGLNSFPIVFLDAYTGEITEDRYYDWLAKVEPGGVAYTNVNLTLAGRVLESVSGLPWKDALDEHVFEPAGMHRTTAYASEMYSDANCAFPMEDTHNGLVACNVRKSDSTMHAAGGAGTCSSDAARWLLLHLNRGELDGTYLMEPEMGNAMHTKESDTRPKGGVARLDGYGLAWHVGNYRGRPYATHGGGYVGTAAHFSYLPEHGIGVAILANSSPGGQALIEVISVDIYDRLLGEEGHHDKLPELVKRIGRMRAEDQDAPDNNLVAAGSLSLAPKAYVGSYSHADWGTLTLQLVDGELLGRIGDLELTLSSLGENSMGVTCAAFSDAEGSFAIDQDRVQAISISLDNYQIQLFKDDK